MTTPKSRQSAEPPAADEKPDIEQIQATIEQTREELGETVDALSAKLDVKSRTKARLVDTRHQAGGKWRDAQAKASGLTRSAQDAATDDQGRPKPAVIAGAAGVAAVLVTMIAVAVWRNRRATVPVVAWRKRRRTVPVVARRRR